MSSFNEPTGLGYLKTDAIEFVKYPASQQIFLHALTVVCAWLQLFPPPFGLF
jgi:hypothetical protein